MPAFLPFLSSLSTALNAPQRVHDVEDSLDVLDALQRIGPILLSHAVVDQIVPQPDSSSPGNPNGSENAHINGERVSEPEIRLQPESHYYVLADASFSTSTTPEQVTGWLNQGAQKVVLTATTLSKVLSAAPDVSPSRFLLYIDTTRGSSATVSERIRNAVSGVIVKVDTVDTHSIQSLKGFFPNLDMFVLAQKEQGPEETIHAIRNLKGVGATLVIPTEKLSHQNTSDGSTTSVSDAFLAPLSSDRPDGLYPTVVTSHTTNSPIGLVYSSRESVSESIRTGKGVYQSRKHGLWRKGETSGATQTVVSIRSDCDNDALEFNVLQTEPGFCHLNRHSCFGEGQPTGLGALERTLLSRLNDDAPEKSYTKRLFSDDDLLSKKIMEEAGELCAAETKDDIAFEAADLIYFALVKCIKNGVRLKDVENALDAKALKVTRRKGDAKPNAPQPPTTTNGTTQPSHANTATKAPLTNGVNGTTPATNGVNGVAGVNGVNGHLRSTPPEPSAPISAPNIAKDAQVSDRISMRSVFLSDITPEKRQELLQRPVLKSEAIIPKVQPIVNQVREKGDSALRELTAKFDRANLDQVVIRPPFFNPNSSKCLDGKVEIDLDPEVRKAIDTAYGNVRQFHAAQVGKAPLVVETMPGVVCQRFAKPINRVGLYVPGGTAILPSTALMLGIPAQVAGCKEIVLATPPRPDGTISPEVLYVAHIVGATGLLKSGGAQAVAALAYGTETVPKVDKIFGPGNQWVTAAKMLVQMDSDANVAIDMPAGPSEVLVIADEASNPAFVAADLLSQAEHGVDSQVVLICINVSQSQFDAIENEIDRQAHLLPRVDIVRKSVAKSLVVRVNSLKEAMDFSNDYAPEHLIVNLSDTQGVLDMVENAGSVFIGQYTPESCGDYASGTNHTLPTNGFARQYSGVNTQSFQKHITSQEITREGLKLLGPTVITLADCEGLAAHGNAVRVRLGALQA